MILLVLDIFTAFELVLMAGTSVNGLMDMSTPVAAIKDIVIVWLDKCSVDYEKCKEELSNDGNVRQPQWRFFTEEDKCYQFIKQAEHTEILVFVSSGRLIQPFIDELHNLAQLHSIYIYCNKKSKYESWRNTYKKIHGIFDDPIQLCNSMRNNLNEVRRFQQNLSFATEMMSLPTLSRFPIPCIFNHELKSFYQPNFVWRPWKTNIWTLRLPFKGQGTVEIRQRQLIPFQLSVFNQRDSAECISDNCEITLKVNTDDIQLGTIDAREVHKLRMSNQTDELHHSPQVHRNRWHRYWFTFSGEHQILRFGTGEVRPKFNIFEKNLNEYEKSIIKNASHLHLKISDGVSPRTMVRFHR